MVFASPMIVIRLVEAGRPRAALTMSDACLRIRTIGSARDVVNPCPRAAVDITMKTHNEKIPIRLLKVPHSLKGVKAGHPSEEGSTS